MKKVSPSNYILCFISTILFFVILEIFLSLFWPHTIRVRPYHEVYHPLFGWANKPGMKGYVFIGKHIAFYRTHNSHGLRSIREIPYEKLPGRKRVLLLGDSFFWGYGVNDNDVISEVMQRMVGSSVEIINGAVTGYGTDQELLWLAEEGLKYQPDLVILGFFGNDQDEISNSIYYGYPKPYFSLINGKLVLKNVPVPDTRETRRKAFEEPDTWFGKLKKFLRHNIHTYQFIIGRLNSVPAVRNFFLKTGLAEEFTRALPGVPAYTLKKEMLYPLLFALLKEIKNICDEAGAKFLLVYIPERENTPGTPVHHDGVLPDAVEINNSLSALLKKFAKKNNIEFFDLLPVVREYHKKGIYLYRNYRYDHHWSPMGHKIAAETLVSLPIFLDIIKNAQNSKTLFNRLPSSYSPERSE